MKDLSQIQLLPSKLSSGLTETDKRYVGIALLKKVAEIEEKEVLQILFNVIRAAYHNTGTKLPDSAEEVSKEISMTAQSWYSAIMLDQKYMSLDEIKLAVQMGTIGKFSPHYGKISVEWLMSCLSAYKESRERTDAIKKYNALLNQSKPEKTDAEKEQLFRQAYEQCVKHVQSGKDVFLLDLGNTVSRALWKSGKLNRDKWDEYCAEADYMLKKDAQERLEAAKSKIDRIQVNLISAELEEMERADDYSQRVKDLAAKIALKDYVQNH